jgi:hypothetical protein
MDYLDIAKHYNSTGDWNSCSLTSEDFHKAIERRAEAIRRPGQSAAQAYTEILGTPEGIALHAAYKRAPKPPVQAPQDTVTTMPPAGPASAELERMAREMARSKGVSFQRAYTQLYTDPERAELVARMRLEERAATSRVAEARWPLETANAELGQNWSLGESKGSARM